MSEGENETIQSTVTIIFPPWGKKTEKYVGGVTKLNKMKSRYLNIFFIFTLAQEKKYGEEK